MSRTRRSLASLATALTALGAAACQPVSPDPSAPPAGGPSAAVTGEPGPKFDAIGPDETISFLGTEPFWGGKVAAGRLTYSTPENEAGETVAARRFAGNNGLGFSGTLASGPFDLAITPGTCSDGMSDRVFPYTATLRIAGEQRNGCAWTERQPYSGPRNP